MDVPAESMDAPTDSVDANAQPNHTPIVPAECTNELKPTHVYVHMPDGYVKLVFDKLVNDTPEEMNPILDELVKHSGIFSTREDVEDYMHYGHLEKPEIAVFGTPGVRLVWKSWVCQTTHNLINHAILFAREQCPTSAPYSLVFVGKPRETDSEVYDPLSKWRESLAPHQRDTKTKWHRNVSSDEVSRRGGVLKLRIVEQPEWIRRVLGKETSQQDLVAKRKRDDTESSIPKSKRQQSTLDGGVVWEWYDLEQTTMEKRSLLSIMLLAEFRKSADCPMLNPNKIDFLNDPQYPFDTEAFLEKFAKRCESSIPMRGHPVLFEALRAVGFGVELVERTVKLTSDDIYDVPCSDDASRHAFVRPQNI